MAAVGALVIPDVRLASVCADFERLLRQFGATRELKGAQLTENQARAVISMLRKYDVIFDATAINIGYETEASLRHHQSVQADKLTASLTREHQPTLVEEVSGFRDRLLGLSLQLFVQARLMWRLIDRLIRVATLYYSQRCPRELGAFAWRFDAKEPCKVTEFEELWSSLLFPLLQTRSEAEPHVLLEGADYSHFRRFDRLATLNGTVKSVTDLRALFHDRKFVQSQHELGVQLCDMVLGIFTRALNGTLQTGWEHLGRLMIRGQRGRGPDLVTLEFRAHTAGRRLTAPRLATVCDQITNEMRPILLGASFAKHQERTSND